MAIMIQPIYRIERFDCDCGRITTSTLSLAFVWAEHEELSQMLMVDTEAGQCEMGPRLFDELAFAI
jgi:hypothetical protein